MPSPGPATSGAQYRMDYVNANIGVQLHNLVFMHYSWLLFVTKTLCADLNTRLVHSHWSSSYITAPLRHKEPARSKQNIELVLYGIRLLEKKILGSILYSEVDQSAQQTMNVLVQCRS